MLMKLRPGISNANLNTLPITVPLTSSTVWVYLTKCYSFIMEEECRRVHDETLRKHLPAICETIDDAIESWRERTWALDVTTMSDLRTI